MRKYALAFLIVSLVMSKVDAQQHQLVKKWETDTLLKVPESVLFDETNKVLYVANIDGQPGEKDGKGSIGKVGLDGKIVKVDWISGLNAPKGMGIYQGILYVADLEELAVIDIKSGMITKRIPVIGAKFLNDVSVDNKGVVYVSDSRTRKVHRVEKGTVSTILDSMSLKGPNGVLAHRDNFYVLDAGTMYKMETDKRLTKMVEGMEGGTDGIENVTGNEFIVSCWGGVIYYVKGDGSKEKLLDTREQKINSADIGYDAKNRIVYVPTFWKNSVVAYEVK
ncbi:MAG: ATP/GTP-binding protein [Chitinophagaceae bacterium]